MNQKDRVIEGISAIPYIHFTPIYDLFEKEFVYPWRLKMMQIVQVYVKLSEELLKMENIVFFVLGTGMEDPFLSIDNYIPAAMYGGEFGMSLN